MYVVNVRCVGADEDECREFGVISLVNGENLQKHGIGLWKLTLRENLHCRVGEYLTVPERQNAIARYRNQWHKNFYNDFPPVYHQPRMVGTVVMFHDDAILSRLYSIKAP